jgi:1-acyl-sn-glycerol-3-phosphate acyltransferase
MARKGVLGNDPFERGAAVRGEPAVPAAKDERPKALDIEKPRPRPRAEAASAPRPMAPPAPAESDEAAVRPPIPPTLATELLETAGERLRHFLEQTLPATTEALVRGTIDALGLATIPVQVSDVDDLGMSNEFVDRWQPFLKSILERYFRAQLVGFEHIPEVGPALLVANHSGLLPHDEVLLKVAVTDASRGHRALRPLTEDFAINAPFAGSWLNRFGCVRACQENAMRLLTNGDLAAVFPEGSHGIGKLFRDRYRLGRFGRGGFVKLALRTGVPLLPVAIFGWEESQPVLAKLQLPRSLGLPYLPITPTFPWLGPLGLTPLPTRLVMQVGEPLLLGHRPADAENRSLVAEVTEDMRNRVQLLLDGLRAPLRSVFF